MGTLASFKNYQYSTANEEKAAKIREVCDRNPHDYWEITSDMLVAPKQEVQPEPEKKKAGRPKGVSVFRGMKTSVPSEGE